MTDSSALPATFLMPFSQDDLVVLRRLAIAFGDLNPSEMKRLARIADWPDEDLEILHEIIEDRQNMSWAYRHLKSAALLVSAVLAGLAAWKTFIAGK